MNRLENAIAFAAGAHSGQVDKAGKPYILHPLRVMLSLDEEDLQIAAVLHDVVEDTEFTLEDIRSRWGDRVAELVDCLSRREDETYAEFTARCAHDKGSAKVKLMDLSDNLSPARYTPSLEGIQKRYKKAVDYILEHAFPANDRDAHDIEFLTKHKFI